MGRLDGKVAIITGAASGMGAEEAKLFAKEGAKVVATDVQFDKLEKIVKEIKQNGGKAIAIKHNVASEEEWKAVVEKAVNSFGKVDVLLNNAAIADKNPISTPENTDVNEWDMIINVNLKGVFLGMKHVLPVMKQIGGGSIINVSSVAALKGGSGAFAYTATKGGIRSITKHVAFDYGPYNIRVNSLHPGATNTPMLAPVLNNPEISKHLTEGIPLRRVSEPIEMAHAALFLASDESGYMTGAELVIDGGMVIV